MGKCVLVRDRCLECLTNPDDTNKYIGDMRPNLLIGDALYEGPSRRPEGEVNESQLISSKKRGLYPNSNPTHLSSNCQGHTLQLVKLTLGTIRKFSKRCGSKLEILEKDQTQLTYRVLCSKQKEDILNCQP
jgi:hypothetical protein